MKFLKNQENSFPIKKKNHKKTQKHPSELSKFYIAKVGCLKNLNFVYFDIIF